MKTEQNNTISHDRRLKRKKRSQLLLMLPLALLNVTLCWAYFSPGADSIGLHKFVSSSLKQSGVESEVTAVLLNFRGYDTMLECFVLFLGAVAIWSLPPHR